MSTIQHLTVSEPFLRLGSLLAEGPIYRPEDNTLHFIDIKGKLVHCVPLSDSLPSRTLAIEDMLGVACFIEGDNDNYIVAAKRGFGLVDQCTGKLTYLAKLFANPEDEKRLSMSVLCQLTGRLRFNDGAVDCMGRFWAGSMFEYVNLERC
jgi:sugar lactone lactonase YvrE